MGQIIHQSYLVQSAQDTVVTIAGDATYAGAAAASLNGSPTVVTGTQGTYGIEPDGLHLSFYGDNGSSFFATLNNTTTGNYTVAAVPSQVGIDESTGDYFPVVRP